ncbi:Phosphoserine phosphatase 1 [Nonomuraea coxensis DSM 45129]|uniref:phosphoglycerate mutase (2,3-diphosphoglycerate-dependent) n=1 Tax=Nonomuraea coxensis DSM 45129 TaxID=1122611 RepID=A0ABX8U6W1_9ACTN|nr:histidine phosphatase family protein [Nonomuraea coxensis]QYC43491.1 Phosphoserine phosphatase 1 [Nonomuraea coxensis DSM 45129]
MTGPGSGPSRIIAVRHGESEANLAHREAGERPLVYGRGDDEVRLTALGRRQSAALGRLLAALPDGERPEAVWCSPYLRALETWEVARDAWGVVLPVTVDERLRDQEQGAFDRLNPAAVRERFPEEAARREAAGVYAFRPPGGESLADVVARLRAFVEDLDGQAADRRVLIVAHDSVVLGLHQVLTRDPHAGPRLAPVLNASVSVWRAGQGSFEVVRFNDVGHLA